MNAESEIDLLVRKLTLTDEEQVNWEKYVAFVKGVEFKPKKPRANRSTSLIKHSTNPQVKLKPLKKSNAVIKPDWKNYYIGDVVNDIVR